MHLLPGEEVKQEENICTGHDTGKTVQKMDSYKTFCSRKNTRLSYTELYKDACGSRGYDAEAEQVGNVQRKPASLPQAVNQNLLFSIHSSVR